jgi:hypothetical protein
VAELDHKNLSLEKESKKQQKVEEELRDKKKDHGKLVRDMTKLEQQIKDSVCILNGCFKFACSCSCMCLSKFSKRLM